MKVHKAPVDRIETGSDILEKIPEILDKYRNIYMVSDENTYAACGRRVEEILIKSGQFSHGLILPKNCVPDYAAAGNILLHANDVSAESDIFSFSTLPDFILGVGSGVINDSCRVVSYRLGIPYGICGTAPSMDGYASAGSSMMVDGAKHTIKCTTPRVIIADIKIMKNAPYELLLAGIGDMFGKYTAIFDWELSREKTGEYYCEEIAKDVLKAADECLANGYRLAGRSEQTVHNIIDGLIVSGLGMAYTGVSRPASGAEHVIAHVWETESIASGKIPDLHGIDVCEGSLLQYIMLKKLYGETKDAFVKKLIAKYMPSFEKVEKFCKDTNYPIPVKDESEIRHAILRALTLRNRYTTISYLNSLGKLEEYAEYAAAEFTKTWLAASDCV